jgi:hypothetical protein
MSNTPESVWPNGGHIMEISSEKLHLMFQGADEILPLLA